MQTTIELSPEALTMLDALSAADGVPSAELAGKVVEAYVKERQPAEKKERDWAGLDAAFGIWKDLGEDGLAYQARMRNEWER